MSSLSLNSAPALAPGKSSPKTKRTDDDSDAENGKVKRVKTGGQGLSDDQMAALFGALLGNTQLLEDQFQATQEAAECPCEVVPQAFHDQESEIRKRLDADTKPKMMPRTRLEIAGGMPALAPQKSMNLNECNALQMSMEESKMSNEDFGDQIFDRATAFLNDKRKSQEPVTQTELIDEATAAVSYYGLILLRQEKQEKNPEQEALFETNVEPVIRQDMADIVTDPQNMPRVEGVYGPLLADAIGLEMAAASVQCYNNLRNTLQGLYDDISEVEMNSDEFYEAGRAQAEGRIIAPRVRLASRHGDDNDC